ncbi:hypothetical protein ACIRP2_27935 [Streptomyces sp. NPDC101194]|uniref:hypothetical protein n=1 Tax=Streptomyces sp. NPDC101194 TaxID=3366127 RepID=UPI00380EDBFD
MIERAFTAGGVPGVPWSPASGADRAPPVLMGHGHGGDNHKKHLATAGRAQLLVTGCGIHGAVIHVPGQGDRQQSRPSPASPWPRSRESPAGERLESRAAEHLALEHIDPVDLAFDHS